VVWCEENLYQNEKLSPQGPRRRAYLPNALFMTSMYNTVPLATTSSTVTSTESMGLPTSAVGRIPFGEVEMITQSFYDEAKAKWEAIANEPNQIKRSVTFKT
jgi:hypothetical protein